MIATIDEVTKALERNYTGNIAAVSRLPPTKCDTFQARYEDGTERFVKVGEYSNEDRYASQIALAGLLSEQNLPIPAVIKTVAEKNYFHLGEKRYLEMHSWIPNARHCQLTVPDIKELAEVMAKIHTAADTFDQNHPEIKFLSMNPYTGMPSGRALPSPELLDEFKKRLDEIPAALRPYFAEQLPLMQEALITEIPGKDWGFMHADLHRRQTMFDQDTHVLKGIIDWEWALYGPRAWDISWTLSTLMDGEKTPDQSNIAPIPRDLMEAFIDTYVTSRPDFPVEDLRAASQLLEWGATCRRTLWFTEVLKGVSEERVTQLISWFGHKGLERAREFRTLSLI